MPSSGFGPDMPASFRPQTLALDSSATGIGVVRLYHNKKFCVLPTQYIQVRVSNNSVNKNSLVS